MSARPADFVNMTNGKHDRRSFPNEVDTRLRLRRHPSLRWAAAWLIDVPYVCPYICRCTCMQVTLFTWHLHWRVARHGIRGPSMVANEKAPEAAVA